MLYEIHPLLALTYRVQPVVVWEHLRVVLPTLASCGVPPIGYTAAITFFSAPSTFTCDTDDERGVATRPSTPVVVSVCVAGEVATMAAEQALRGVLQFGSHFIPRVQVFLLTPLSFAFTNRKPILPGRILPVQCIARSTLLHDSYN